MSYKNYSKMTKEERRRIYEQQKIYRATMKNLCLIIPKGAYATIKEHADEWGISVTRFMLYSSLRVCGMLDNGEDIFHVYD